MESVVRVILEDSIRRDIRPEVSVTGHVKSHTSIKSLLLVTKIILIYNITYFPDSFDFLDNIMTTAYCYSCSYQIKIKVLRNRCAAAH